MKNRDIYKAALHLLSQSADEGENPDFEERAPYLLASFCSEVFEIDRIYRSILNLPPIDKFDRVWLPLDEDFPLVERLASVASKYLAAMLVIDEDSELSDKLYEHYCDGISRLRAELPCVLESIKNKYI
ncbi:MAG: hypothetical protein E7607_03255 [Ruminococcaceae bacterium]|nr:hypothetical protein [Oscillospiraceae bacterium]